MVNLLIPAAVVATLRIPEMALTTGGMDVVWHDRTWGRMRWSRRSVIRLPYDPAAAAKLRNYDRLNRFHLILPLYAILTGFWVLHGGPPHSWTGLAPSLLFIIATALEARWNVTPRPSRTGTGDLYLAGLPDEVAERWIAANPQVQAVAAAPVYRLFRPRAYILGAVVCALTAILAIRTLFDGEDHSLVFLVGPPALIIATFVFAYRAVPTGYIRGHD